MTRNMGERTLAVTRHRVLGRRRRCIPALSGRADLEDRQLTGNRRAAPKVSS